MYIAPAFEKESRFRVRCIVPLIALLGTTSVAGQGTFLYDQQSALEDAQAEGAADIQALQPMGQSFTPNLPTVGFIRLWLGDGVQNNGLGATVYINLRSNSIVGPVFASTQPVQMPDNFGRGARGFADFIFSTPASVTPGVTYFFQPIVQSGDLWVAGSDAHYAYAGGTAFANGLASPDFDLWFREGIIIPEPTSGVLLLFGLAAFLYVRRARMRKTEQI